jgi:hypothetical protein
MLDLSDAVFSSFSFLRLKQFIHQSKPLLCKGHSTAWVLLAIFGQCLVLTEDIVETRSAPRDTLSLVRRLILVSIYYRYPLIGDHWCDLFTISICAFCLIAFLLKRTGFIWVRQ